MRPRRTHRPRLAIRLGDDMHAVHARVLERLYGARRPADHRALHASGAPEPEVQSPVVLARESHTAVHGLELAPRAALEGYLRADRAAVRACAYELEGDPVMARYHAVLVDPSRLLLVRDHDVEHPTVEQVDQHHGAAVVLVGHPDLGGDVAPARQAAVHEHPR